MNAELLVLRTYRDKIGAHSEAGAKVEHLASIDSHEKLFDFADRFYRLIANAFVRVQPSLIGTQVGTGAVRVMEALGIEKPKSNFDESDSSPSIG